MMRSKARGQEDVENVLKRKYGGLEEGHPLKQCYRAMLFPSSPDSVKCFMHWEVLWESLSTSAFGPVAVYLLVSVDLVSASKVAHL